MALSDQELNELRTGVRKLLTQELGPLVHEYETKGEFCIPAFKKLAEMGYAAAMLPEPYGMGSLMAQVIVAEEMGRICNGFGLSTLATICLFGGNVAWQGTEAQKEKYLPGIVSGEKIGCWGLTEPDVGSDAVSIKTRCMPDGDEYILNGSKTFVTNAPIADYFIVIAREMNPQTKEPVLGEKGNPFVGGTAFILERGTAGLSTGNPFKKLGHRSSPTGEIFMENVRVPKSQVLGKPGMAFLGMKHSLDVERATFSGLGIGLMDSCVETMVKYGLSRTQFGKPIIEHQMIQDKIAKSAAQLDLIREYGYLVARKIEQGQDVNKEAAIVKYIGSTFANDIAREAVQCLGGNGYIEEYDVERHFRDAKLYEIGGGTSEIQKMIIAKQVIKELM